MMLSYPQSFVNDKGQVCILEKYKQQLIENRVVLPANVQSKASIEQNNHGDVKKFHQTLWLY